ncbi:MAG: HlyD family efflux transporter periplasmic adaptor subunit [Lachnospiraceae bacterium]|nr:HlyD family efflux transporter periplasmic adaptor subunit [Lachnospiraceae bacterium]
MDGKPVMASHGYLALCLENRAYSIFDTVDNPSAPAAIVSSFQMDWNSIAEIMEGTGGTRLPEELRGETVYDTIDENTVPYNLEEVAGIPAGDGSKESPYRILCIQGAAIERSFLEAALESQLVYQFDVVDDRSAPNYIRHSWLLNGAVVEDPEDPGMDDPGFVDPGLEIPTGPTKEELTQQIKEKEETLKNLELNKRTAELELKQLKRQVDDGVIESTVDGTVKSVLDEDTAKLEGSPLIRVTGEEGFYITGSVAETALDKIEKGMAVNVSSWNTGMSYEAEITSISNSPSSGNYYGGNPNMSYYPFTAVIREDAELSNGEGVDLSVEGLNSSSYDPDAIYLSQAFVREEGARYYVYKKGEDDRLTKQYVDVGKIVYGSLEITSGLTQDDEIAFPYGRDVKEGAKTEPTDTLYNYGF